MPENFEQNNDKRREGGYRGKGEGRRTNDGRSGRKPYGERGDRGDRAGRGERGDRGERKPYGERGERKPYGDRSERGGRKPYGDRAERGERGDRKSYGNRSDRSDRGERKSYGDRKPFVKDGESYDRKPRPEGEGRREFDRDRKPRPEGDRKPRPEGDRAGRAERGDRKPRGNGAPRHAGHRADRMGERRPRGGKAHQGPSAGRKAAFEILSMLRERDAFARDLLSKHVDGSSMSREDRAFATRLVLGVVSASGTLDEMLDRCMDSPDDIQADVRDALRISTYEILFLEKTAYAAVNEGVELVRSFAPQAARLANAVLRRVSAKAEEFPFGDADREMEAFARKYAFPTWLAMLLLRDLGMEAARDFMAASNEPAPLYIAVNAAKASPEDVLPTLEVSKGAPEPVEVDGELTPGCYRLADARVLADGPVRPLLDEGKIIVSDASAQTVAYLVLPDDKPESFLEIGAGRGTKTVLLQSQALRKYGTQIDSYVTLDNLEFKTKVLSDRAKQCGIQVEEALTGDALALDAVLGDRTFDVVFVDAPCSGLGTLRRHPEIRWRMQEEGIESMSKQGLEMLTQASKHVAVGGTLAYATCTVTHEENNAVVRRFLESEAGSGFSLAPLRGKGCFSTRLVEGGPDAHFAVRFVRNS